MNLITNLPPTNHFQHTENNSNRTVQSKIPIAVMNDTCLFSTDGCENKKCDFYSVCESDGVSEGKCVCPQSCNDAKVSNWCMFNVLKRHYCRWPNPQ